MQRILCHIGWSLLGGLIAALVVSFVIFVLLLGTYVGYRLQPEVGSIIGALLAGVFLVGMFVTWRDQR